MTRHAGVGQDLAKGAGVLLGHVLAIIVGLVLMIVGLGLGVTIVALPVGIGVGFAGLGIFLWGLFGWAQRREVPKQPPGTP
jgi:hypothetical protein